jgi:hypothetical protein
MLNEEEILKVFLHPPPPSEGENFSGFVESKILKPVLLSISKWNCENYLLRIINGNLV